MHRGPRGRHRLQPLASAAVALLAACVLAPAQAASLRYCDEPAALNATQQDRVLRFAALVKDELARSGQRVALVARSGLDLAFVDQRYSHAGVALADSGNTPWSVRQLYFACDEGRPRLFDQGLAGFIVGAGDASAGRVSVLLLPGDQARALAEAALDNRRALQLLGAQYSANAHAFATTYQNCNQWLAELLAATWGALPDGDDLRQRAQGWLQQQGYQPTVFATRWWPVMWLTRQISWLHTDDHPADDLDQWRYRVSMPASIEAFVQARVPGAQRLEFCHDGHQAVLRRGWTPLGGRCEAAPGDEVTALD